MSLEFLESVECKGKVIRGKIYNYEVYLLAKDITDLFGYKNGKNTVNKKVSKENILKFPLDGVNGNQYNLIDFLQRKNEFLISERNFVWFEKAKEMEKYKEKKKPFWKKLLGI